MQSKLNCTADEIWPNLGSTATFLKVSRPLMNFKSLDPKGLPEQWMEGKTYGLGMYFLGFIPLGRHTITFRSIDHENLKIKTEEKGLLIKSWNHTMQVYVNTSNQLFFQDELKIDNGWMSVPTYVGAYIFFLYRHWKMKRLFHQD
ncbi:hypothetical protein [Paenibacillus sp. N3.4]|uniref:hypothetical protein n=1 Tax=Paenibacillus sp. N3.4 TaxID=2603222 RepID=UPI0016500561|nr:hypothetical protein [Paenibacillus sp. N3.4]